MTIEEKVQTVLEANGPLIASVPAARIRVPGEWQNLSQPYITHRPISVRPTETHEGLKKLRVWEFYQISVFSSTFMAGRNILELVITALAGSHGTTRCRWRGNLVYVGRDDERAVEEFAADFEIAEVAD